MLIGPVLRCHARCPARKKRCGLQVFPESFSIECIFETAHGEVELYEAQNAKVAAAEATVASDAGMAGDAAPASGAGADDGAKSPGVGDDRWDDADLTTDDEDDEEDEWEGLPITDV